MSRSNSRRPSIYAQYEEQKKQNHAVLRKSVTENAILKSGQLTVPAGTTKEEQIEQIDNLVKRHPIKQLYSKEFRTRLCDKRKDVFPIYLNPYLVGITYLRRLSAGARSNENGHIGSITLNKNMKDLLETMSSKEWSKKLTGTIFTADYLNHAGIIARLKDHGAIQIGTEITPIHNLHGAWNHVSGGSLTFAINDATTKENKAHVYASEKHLYAITGYQGNARFTITTRNYSDLRWITCCVWDGIEEEMRTKRVLVIFEKDKESKINELLHNLVKILDETGHSGEIVYGECYFEFDPESKWKPASVVSKFDQDIGKGKTVKFRKEQTNFDFIIALPGHLTLSEKMKYHAECMTVRINDQLTETTVSPDLQHQYQNLEIFRSVDEQFGNVISKSKNELFGFGEQVCSLLDHQLLIQKNVSENRVLADKAISEN